MANIQCKQCGGELKLPDGVTAGECPYCGSYTTFPKLSGGQAEQLYNRAEQFRRNNDFDRAEQAYTQFIQASPDDPEGYWGLVLSRFGIEYVEDPVTHERIPTCHRVQYDPITKDPDYLRTMELASGYDRDLYEKEARRIEEIQQKILTVSAQEKPYDIFICFKDTTDGGTRTEDSVDAQEWYDKLTNAGYRVFFSRITLEDKVGQDYEPYIFAALDSAKVMLVIGSKKEYFEATWVRNEWSRFLALKRKYPSKTLIPCYKRMTAYDLPPELSRLQAQDMGKVGAEQDLLRGIKKILNMEEQSERQSDAPPTKSGTSVNNLLRRAQLFVESGEFDSAFEYCDKVLDQDPENGDAYWYRLMAEKCVANEHDLSRFPDVMDSPNFKMAAKFAKGRLAATISSVRNEIKAARENAEKEEKLRLWQARQEEAYNRQVTMEYVDGVKKKFRLSCFAPFFRVFDFSGRSTRKEYWSYVFMYALVWFGLALINEKLASIWALLNILPSLSVTVRRLHDGGSSGWMLLIVIIPIANLLLLVDMLKGSVPGPNKYGPQPED